MPNKPSKDRSTAPDLAALPTEDLVRALLARLDDAPDRDGLRRTPKRVAESLAHLTSGRAKDPRSVLNDAVFEHDADEMVVVRDIELYSLCEHHLLPFFGRAHVAYLPKGKIIGLSKLPRIVDVFARRLQVQERLTQEVAEALEEICEPRGVAVICEARHFCMMMRGVEKQSSSTTTSAMRGAFKRNRETRQEFLSLVQKSLG